MAEQALGISQTEERLRDFVRTAVAKLLLTPADGPTSWDVDAEWERGPDGNFHERTKPRRLSAPLTDEWLQSVPGYDRCIEGLRSKPTIAKHLDRLVGTSDAASHLDANTILWALVHAMVNKEGSFVFSDEKFDRKWREFADFFSAETISSKLIAPLPYLLAPFPIHLNNELTLDQLTDPEVTQCCNVGVLRPLSRRFPVIVKGAAVGIRRITCSRKLIGPGEEPGLLSSLDSTDEGTFGNRPTIRDDLIVDDVLSALRLFKHIGVSCTGSVQWCETFPGTGVRYRVLRSTPLGGHFELGAAEVPEFLGLWRLLEGGAGRLGFIIHRFNLAFDRGLLVDRIVDLVIAAESLLLRDLTERGEMRFRFAVRAAKFIEHPHYSERDVFRVMRRAYDARARWCTAARHRIPGCPIMCRQPCLCSLML